MACPLMALSGHAGGGIRRGDSPEGEHLAPILEPCHFTERGSED
jgi:hypothetical protein